MQDQENISHALEQARNGDYSAIRGHFLRDYKGTSLCIAEIYLHNPNLDIEKDAAKGGFLERVAQNAFSEIPDEEAARRHLADTLSTLRPRTILGSLESGLYISTFFLTKIVLLPDNLSFKLCDWVTYAPFRQKRENRYRQVLQV